MNEKPKVESVISVVYFPLRLLRLPASAFISSLFQQPTKKPT